MHTLYRYNDINDLEIVLTEKQKLLIQLAFLGADTPPEKVILLMRDGSEEDYSKVFNTLETLQFSYIVPFLGVVHLIIHNLQQNTKRGVCAR